jgi:hypothetical protein
MKKLISCLVAVSAVFFLSNCSKSSTSPTPLKTYPIVGFWIGTQVAGDGSTTVPLYYSFDIREDNTLLMQGEGGNGNTYYATGTWTLSGSAFTSSITVSNLDQKGVKQNITAIYDSLQGKLMNGTIQTVGYPYSTTFIMDRAN